MAKLEIVNRAGCPIRRGWPWQDGDQSCSGTYLAVSCSVCFTFDGGDKVPHNLVAVKVRKWHFGEMPSRSNKGR